MLETVILPLKQAQSSFFSQLKAFIYKTYFKYIYIYLLKTEKCLATNSTLLVFDKQAISRGATVVLAYIMKKRRWQLQVSNFSCIKFGKFSSSLFFLFLHLIYMCICYTGIRKTFRCSVFLKISFIRDNFWCCTETKVVLLVVSESQNSNAQDVLAGLEPHTHQLHFKK